MLLRSVGYCLRSNFGIDRNVPATLDSALSRILLLVALVALSQPHVAAFHVNRVIVPPRLSEAQLDREIKLHPNSAAVYCDRADSYVCAGETESALPDYDRALQLNAHCARALLGKSVALQSLSRLDEALQFVDRAIIVNEKSITGSAIMQKINVLIELKKERETIPEYLRLIASRDLGLKPGDKKTLYMSLGDMYLKLNEPDKAIQMLAKGIEGERDIPPKYYAQRARAYRKLGKNTESLANYSKAIEQLRVKAKSELSYEALLLNCYRERIALYDQLGQKELAGSDRKALARLDKDNYGVTPFQVK